MAPYLERRTGPRKLALAATDVPGTLWNPILDGMPSPSSSDHFARSIGDITAPPAEDDAIAFAPVTHLSRWIEARKLTSERLTSIYLDRIARLAVRVRKFRRLDAITIECHDTLRTI